MIMTTFKSSDLPGVGRRYSLEFPDGKVLVVIVHHTGSREIYLFSEDTDREPDFWLELSDSDARKLGSALIGADYQPVPEEKVEMFFKNIRIQWIQVEGDCPLTNRSIEDLQIRTRTGATIIGIHREGEIIGSPDVDEIIYPGDLLMVVGDAEQLDALRELTAGSG